MIRVEVREKQHVNPADRDIKLIHSNGNAATCIEQQNLAACLDQCAGPETIGSCLRGRRSE
jgi:hypothetical protein